MKLASLLLGSLLSLLLLGPVSARETAENRFPFREGDILGGAVPSPDAFLGAPLGSRFTLHHDMLRYLRHLDEVSDRISVESYGVTPEGRELVLCFIGDPKHVAGRSAIRAQQQRLADPRLLERPEELGALIEEQPAVLWMSYNVHGNEASATEAALWTIYQLVDGLDDASGLIREGALTIVDPCLNPDGRDRYTQWFRSARTVAGDPDPASREHDEPWPGGRSNHYLFDLNRDWAWQSQPETRARIREYLRWWPLIHVDFHEMSPESSYFFFPATKPINANVSPLTLEWADVIGRANASAFDRFGWRYYTGEDFDLFYPAYGDSWPSLQGTIGMTYEQAGGSRGGVRYRQRDGSELTLADRLHHHHVAGMATLLASVEGREELQRDFHRFRQDTIERGRTGEIVEFLFPPAPGGARESLLSLLQAQGIEVEMLAQEVIVEGLADYRGTIHEITKLPAGTASVSLDQPSGRLARSLLEPNADVSDAYFYDVSAWSLPMALGVGGFVASTPFSGMRIPLQLDPPRGVVEGEARVAYLLRWSGLESARALDRLHRQGAEARLLPSPVVCEGGRYEGGTIVVPVRGEETHRVVRAVAEECAVHFDAVDSAWTDEGVDLGSDSVATLRPVRIAVASGEGVSSLSYGAIWSLLEQDMGIPFSAISLDAIGGGSLDRFDVLVLPSGRLGSSLRGSSREALEEWVRAGGVLIALESSAFALGEGDDPLVSRSTRAPDRDAKEEPPVRKTLADLRREREERQVPGNIFVVGLDSEHPLAFGHPSEMFVFMDGTRSFGVEGDGGDVAAFLPEPRASGFISEANLDRVRGRVYLAEERVGRGRVVLFAGDPCFRGFWRGTTGLFLNALLLRSTR